MELEDHHLPQSEEAPQEKPGSTQENEKQEETKEVKENINPIKTDLITSDDQQKLWVKIEKVLEEYFLSQFQLLAVKKFIQDKIADQKCESVDRARNWLFMRLNGRLMPAVVHPRQLGCPDIVPGLTQKGWWERSEISWIAQLEAAASVIREELMQLREAKGFQPYRSPAYAQSKNLAPDKIGSMGTDQGNWNVYYLWLHDIPFKENLEQVPNTVKLLQDIIPRNYFHCFFSALTPGSHITAHNGPTNKKLRVHLPLIGTEGARMRVGDEIKTLEQDKCIIFDDSFNHEAWYDGTQTRINLIVDLWHPELTDDEVKFFSMLLKSKLKGERILSEKLENDDHLYSIIKKTKGILKSNDDWWVN